jgi:hypothetical protein
MNNKTLLLREKQLKDLLKFLKKIEFSSEKVTKDLDLEELSKQISKKYEMTISPGQAEAVLRRVLGMTLTSKERSQLYDLRQKIQRYDKFLTSFQDWGRKYDHQLKLIILGLTEQQSEFLSSILNKPGITPDRDIIGVTFFTKLTENYDKSLTKLQIWDVTGSNRFASIRPQFYRGAAGVLFVFNTEDRDSFEMIEKYFSELKEITNLKFKVRGRFKKEITLITSLLGIGNKLLIPYDEVLSLANKMGTGYGQIDSIEDDRFQDILRFFATIVLYKLKE